VHVMACLCETTSAIAQDQEAAGHGLMAHPHVQQLASCAVRYDPIKKGKHGAKLCNCSNKYFITCSGTSQQKLYVRKGKVLVNGKCIGPSDACMC
jgi:hypothetical protein